MKKTFLIAVFLILGISTSEAQLIKFGLKGGLNYANYNGGAVNNFDINAITSYHAGMVAEIELFENFSLQPELLYSTQGAELDELSTQIKNELGYLSLPVLAKFYLSENKFSLELGPQASVLVSERNKVDAKNSNTFEFGVAGGLSIKITKSIFISGRYAAGLTEAKRDADVKNSVIQLSVGLLF